LSPGYRSWEKEKRKPQLLSFGALISYDEETDVYDTMYYCPCPLSVIEISSDEVDPTHLAPKSKLKGKAKVRENDSKPILQLEGAEQCQSCVKKELLCMINLVSIDRWERQVNAGKLPMKILTVGMGCLECCARGLSCILPQMKAFCKSALVEGKRTLLSAS